MVKIKNWSAVVKHPRFWANYYFIRLHIDGAEDNMEVICSIFDCEPRSLKVFNHELMGFDEDPYGTMEGMEWNTLSFSLPGDYTWSIEFNTTPGFYHYLNHPGFQEPLLVAYDDPHFMLPIFRHQEIKSLVDWAARDWRGPFDPLALYSLFYPLSFLTEDDDLDVANAEIQSAWRAFDVLPEDHIPELARRLLWTGKTLNSKFKLEPVRWWWDSALGWVTNARHSYRNPDNGWTTEDFAHFNKFLSLFQDDVR